MNEVRTPRWTFLTNHARVLAAVARDPNARLRDIAATCRLTERAVQGIVADLERDGYLTRTRAGRRSVYRVTPGTVLRHPADGARPVAEALGLLPVHDHGGAPDDAGEPPVAAHRV